MGPLTWTSIGNTENKRGLGVEARLSSVEHFTIVVGNYGGVAADLDAGTTAFRIDLFHVSQGGHIPSKGLKRARIHSAGSEQPI